MPAIRAALVGLGNIGAGYADDPLTARHFRYATHAQVLRAHPRFTWAAAVDTDPDRRARAQALGAARVVASLRELGPHALDVVVLAMPPSQRLAVLDQVDGVRAVFVEKPLGGSLDESRRFLDACRDRGIAVQVNLWRRFDERIGELASGRLRRSVGAVQAVQCVYGGGLTNNGIHLVDTIRLLAGPVRAVRALGDPAGLANDAVSFALDLESGAVASAHHIDFAHYREVGLTIWGTDGRLTVDQEGLAFALAPRVPHRAVSGSREIDGGSATMIPSTAGVALYRAYDALAALVESGGDSPCSGEEAWQSTRVVEAIRESAGRGGLSIDLRTFSGR
ncbi:MAG: Gfo/Idh/MocA family protein [Vicinamibacterales bacterium]